MHFFQIRKNSGYKYASEALGAYLPIFLVFIVVLGGYWGWTVFGPHSPTARDSWVAAEQKWLQKRDDDRQLGV